MGESVGTELSFSVAYRLCPRDYADMPEVDSMLCMSDVDLG
jgi:hypothetical protein